MNRKLLALAVGAALALPVTAQAAPTVYGLMNLSIDRVDLESVPVEQVEVNSNSSRLGVKGEEALGNGLSAVYKAEWEVAGDVAGATDLTGRDRFLGLKSDTVGTLKLGAFDTPFKTSQGTVDQFNDMTYADMGNFLSGENRLDNMIAYESPKIADVLVINAAVQSGEEVGADDDDAASVSVVFTSGDLYFAAAMDNDVRDSTFQGVMDAALGTSGSGERFARDALRLTGAFTLGDLQLGALLQTSEFNENPAASGYAPIGVVDPVFGPLVLDGLDIDEQSILLSAAYTAGKNVFKGQVIKADYEVEATVNALGTASVDVETTVIELGFDHNFTQNTKAYVQGSMAQYDIAGTELEDTVLSVGMLTRF
ncbi:MAG: outer rane porin [Moraxellaceae bacterium]|jgi:predicted porin|nr:outer rane porin [Moraxellaceae bacterium]